MRILLSVVPALLTFGPFFMVQGLRPDSLSQYLIALGGALALAVGLAVLFRRLSRQQQRIVELEEQVRQLGTASA
jgi:flagellar biogenesis protein FliO